MQHDSRALDVQHLEGEGTVIDEALGLGDDTTAAFDLHGDGDIFVSHLTLNSVAAHLRRDVGRGERTVNTVTVSLLVPHTAISATSEVGVTVGKTVGTIAGDHSICTNETQPNFTVRRGTGDDVGSLISICRESLHHDLANLPLGGDTDSITRLDDSPRAVGMDKVSIEVTVAIGFDGFRCETTAAAQQFDIHCDIGT